MENIFGEIVALCSKYLKALGIPEGKGGAEHGGYLYKLWYKAAGNDL
jgi:hypothetical protein